MYIILQVYYPVHVYYLFNNCRIIDTAHDWSLHVYCMYFYSKKRLQHADCYLVILIIERKPLKN
jgi:hypothetical protein